MISIDEAFRQELAKRDRRIERLESLLDAHVTNNPVWLRTQEAEQVAGVCRQTLVQRARAMAPGITQDGRITYKKDGKVCFYLKSSCIDYAQRKLGQPTLQAAA